MKIVVHIPDDLAAQAQARGLNLSRYLPELLVADLVATRQGQPAVIIKNREATREAAVDAMLQFADSHGLRTDGLDLKSLAHEGHRY